MDEKKQEILPRYAFKRSLVGEGEFRTERLGIENIHPSYNDYSQNMIINEMKEEMLYVNDEPADARTFENLKEEIYELPDG